MYICKYMKIIIAGSRNFNNYILLKDTIDKLRLEIFDIEIVSGTARGADLLGEKYAIENNLKIHRFKPDWNLGKKAGYLRNKDMAEFADGLIAFWDGVSKGTNHMINLAKEKKLKVKIIRYV